MRRIESIEVFPVLLPVIETFQFASESAGTAGGEAPHVFVKVTDSEGEVGWGEGRPVPQWSYETLETVETTIRYHLAPALLGLPVADRWGLHRRMQATIGRGPSTGQPIAKAAIDLAVHDLCARTAGISLRTFLGGGEERASVELSYTLTGHDAAAVGEEVTAAREAGFRHFNFKAALDSGMDVEVARAVREAAGPEAFVWADANQGYGLHQAREAAPRLAAAGVDVLEQPLPADRMHLMRELRKSVQIPLAVDESSVSPADFFAHAAEGLVDYLVVKVTRSGGLWPTLAQIFVAEAAGLPLLVSGLTDGLLTKLAICQVAAAFGCPGPAALNGSQFTDESALFPSKAVVESGGTVHLPSAPGIGVRPDEEALRGHDRRGGDAPRARGRRGRRVTPRPGSPVPLRLRVRSRSCGVPQTLLPSLAHPGRRGGNALPAHDHPWHTGLAMTSAYLSGENFWGGPTFVRDRGYTWLENQGRIKHQTWNEIQSDTSMIELLSWISHQEETWIEEERGISVGEIETAGGFWSLDLSFLLKNVRDRPLIFGSPTTEGRPAAGYGGLFWRGPRSFGGGEILAANGLEGPEVMGRTSPWLAYVGLHDGTGRGSTVLFLDSPANVRFPGKWFVRNDPYACVSCSFMFDEEYVLEPNEELALYYRVVLGDGAWPRERIEDYVDGIHTYPGKES